jgi:HPt (histidine-containing phosphotransfer) domain-containing protein
LISLWMEKVSEQEEGCGDFINEKTTAPTVKKVGEAQAKGIENGMHGTPINLDIALKEFEGDEELLLRVADGFLSNVRNQMVKIQKAFEEANPEIIRAEAHAIKGGAANLTALDLSCVASELESAGHSANIESIPEIMQRFQQEFDRLDSYISNNQIRG